MAKRKKSRTLDWERCECGCKGDSVSAGPLHYWMFNDAESSEGFYLTAGHGFLGENLGRYTSFEEADRAARRHAKPRIVKALAMLKKAAKALQL